MNSHCSKSMSKNNVLKNQKEKTIDSKFFKKRYQFKKFLFYYFFNFCFILLNYIISSQISNNNFLYQTYNTNNNKNESNISKSTAFEIQEFDYILSEVKNSCIIKINFILIIFYGIIIVILILLNLGNRHLNFFYYFISWFYSLNNNLQFQILRSLLINRIPYIHLLYSIPYAHATVIIFYTIFIDSNYLVNTTAFVSCIIIISIFSIGNNWKQPIELIFLIFTCILFSYFTYVFDKREKDTFLNKSKLDESLDKFNFLLQNLNLGFINVKRDYSIDFNLKIRQILEKFYGKKLSRENHPAIKIFLFTDIISYNTNLDFLREIVLENNIFTKKLANKFLANLNEGELNNFLEGLSTNLTIDDNEILTFFNKLIKNIFDKFQLNKFVYLWKLKKINSLKESIYKLFVRFNSTTDSMEFLIIDNNRDDIHQENENNIKLKNCFSDKMIEEIEELIIQINSSIDFILELNKFQSNTKASFNQNINNSDKIMHFKNLKVISLYLDYLFFYIKNDDREEKDNKNEFFLGNNFHFNNKQVENVSKLKSHNKFFNKIHNSNNINPSNNNEINNYNSQNSNHKNYLNFNVDIKNTPLNNLQDLSKSDINLLMNDNTRKNEVMNFNLVNNKNQIKKINDFESSYLGDNLLIKNRQVSSFNKSLNNQNINQTDFKNFERDDTLINNTKNISKLNKILFQKIVYLFEENINKKKKNFQENSLKNSKKEMNFSNIIRNNMSNTIINLNDFKNSFKSDTEKNKKHLIGDVEFTIENELDKMFKYYILFFENLNNSIVKKIKYKIFLNGNSDLNKKVSEFNMIKDIKKNIVHDFLKENEKNKILLNAQLNSKNNDENLRKNIRYLLFYILYYLNNLVKSGVILLNYTLKNEDDNFKLNIEIQGGLDYEIESLRYLNNIALSSSKTFNDKNFKNLKLFTAIFNKNAFNQGSGYFNEHNNQFENLTNQNNSLLNSFNMIKNYDYEIKNLNISPHKLNINNENITHFNNFPLKNINLNANFNMNNKNNGNINKFTFNNFGEKNFSNLSISNSNKNSILGNVPPLQFNNYNNYENNSFFTKSIISQSNNIDINNDNNPNFLNHIKKNSIKDKDNKIFESLRLALVDCGGSLSVSSKDSVFYDLTILIPKKEIYESNEKNVISLKNNYLIKTIGLNNNLKSNYNFLNPLIVNQNNKSHGPLKNSNSIKNNQRLSNLSTANIFLNQNYQKSVFSQEFLEEILQMQHYSKEYLNQNINNNNYFNNYNIISTFSEPNLKNNRSVDRRKFYKMKSYSRRSYSNLCKKLQTPRKSREIQTLDKQINKQDNSEDNFITKNELFPFNPIKATKSKTQKFDHLNSDMKFNNNRVYSRETKSLFRNNTEDKKEIELDQIKNLRGRSNQLLHNENKKDISLELKKKKKKKKLKSDILDSAVDSSVSDSSYTNLSLRYNIDEKIILNNNDKIDKKFKRKNSKKSDTYKNNAKYNKEKRKNNLDEIKDFFSIEDGIYYDEYPQKIKLRNNYKLKILLVEDETFVRKCEVNLIRKYFNNSSEILIEECEDGVECLYKIYNGIKLGIKYDLLITDEKMNFLDGIFLANIIKNLTKKCIIYDLSVILLTFNENNTYINSDSEINKSFKDLFVKVFPKPLEYKYMKNIFSIFDY